MKDISKGKTEAEADRPVDKLALAERLVITTDLVTEFLQVSNSFLKGVVIKGVVSESEEDRMMSPEGCCDPENSPVRKEARTFKSMPDVIKAYTILQNHINTTAENNKEGYRLVDLKEASRLSRSILVLCNSLNGM